MGSPLLNTKHILYKTIFNYLDNRLEKDLEAKHTTPLIAALVPAHNEERLIASTIHSLFNQTVPLSIVLVIADNCNDGTIRIVRELQTAYPNLELMESVNNAHKKAGALNQGFQAICNRPASYKYILQMDADTVLKEDLVQEALIELEDDQKLGGVCSRFGVKPLNEEEKEQTSTMGRLLWKIQNIEYGLSDAYRVENLGSIKVLSGTVTVYKREVLEQVLAKNHYVWDESSRVEDYTLTLDIKKAGWKASVGMEMWSWTDVPLNIRELTKQRERWYGGAADEIRKRGVTSQEMATEVIGIIMTVFLYFCRWLLLGIICYLIIENGLAFLSDLPLYSWILPGVIFVYTLYRFLRYVSEPDIWQTFLTLSYLPMELYAVFRESIFLYATGDSFIRRVSRSW